MRKEQKITTIELEARKALFVRDILTEVDSLDMLDKLQKAYNRLKKKASAKEETIGKEEILEGIDAGLKDVKAGRTRPIEELLAENGLK